MEENKKDTTPETEAPETEATPAGETPETEKKEKKLQLLLQDFV